MFFPLYQKTVVCPWFDVSFVTGMFMDEVSALLLLSPVFTPVALGIIITLNITIALIRPPMGACLFIAAAVSRLDITVLFRTICPFALTAVAVLLVLIFFPGLIALAARNPGLIASWEPTA